MLSEGRQTHAHTHTREIVRVNYLCRGEHDEIAVSHVTISIMLCACVPLARCTRPTDVCNIIIYARVLVLLLYVCGTDRHAKRDPIISRIITKGQTVIIT